MTIDDFFQAVDTANLRNTDRCVYLLWFLGRDDPAKGASIREMCEIIERHGHPKQKNPGRLDDELAKDTRVVRSGQSSWRLKPGTRRQMDAELVTIVIAPRKVQVTNSVLPRVLFRSSRGYIEKVVHQLNASFDHGLYDCCAVMCRRLLETLLIEVYIAKGWAQDIKASDGHFFMFAPLLKRFENDTRMHPSRNAVKGLQAVKELGDLAAHNRMFVAETDDIEKICSGLRVAAGELLAMAGLASQD